MQGRDTVTINGRHYDAVTGMPRTLHPAARARHVPTAHTGHVVLPQRQQRPVDSMVHRQSPHAASVAAGAVHQQAQRSQTLLRNSVHHPLAQAAAPQTYQAPALPPEPTFHAAQTHAQQPQRQLNPSVHTSKELKELLIKERLAEVAAHHQHEHKPAKPHALRSRLIAVAATGMAVLLLGGYFAFLNLPNLSMRVAASQAGIAANFPGYTPQGYSFTGPIAYSPGAVSVSFKSSNDTSYTLKQEHSSWDNQSLLADYVSKQTDSYLTYQDNGITIYSYGNNAVWVNNGLLHIINGDAHLTSDQLINIANSL